MIRGIPKIDIDGYLDRAKPNIKTLIEDQMKEMQPTEVIMTLWVGRKKHVKSAILLDPEDMDGAEDIKGNTDYKYIWKKIPFNTFMTVFFEDRDITELIQHMFAYKKTRMEKSSNV